MSILFSSLALTLAVITPALDPVSVSPARDSTSKPGVFVLGIDGMDPVILQRLMDEGKMPHFKQLATEGTFQTLGTSNPPQSPVAWSNFVTGMNPGGHGIFDFIHRDPDNYIPITSATPAPSGEEHGSIELFGYAIPLGGEELPNNRTGKPYWDYLQEAGVNTEIYRIPGNYPPTPSEALTLSGMGTVDMRGTAGEYTWYTDEILPNAAELQADVKIISPDDEDGDGIEETYRSGVFGPPDSMRVGKGPKDLLSTPLTVTVGEDRNVAWIRVGDVAAPSGQAILQVGEWSEWLPVSFEPMPMMPIGGIVRFYLKELSPNLKLYASPVNIDPEAPAQVIATPDAAAEDLAERIGRFYTQGMPEEVNALKDGLFDDDDYISQVKLVHDEGHDMLEVALERYEPGDMSFMYLSDIDLQCHMLWRHADPKDGDAPEHPAYEAEAASKHEQDIENFYATTDRVLGSVRESLPPETLLLVMSDHGFQAFRRRVHLNAWLRDEGYLVLNGDRTTGAIGPPVVDEEGLVSTDESGVPTHSVDWSKTRAYALGFNGLYLNLEGREVSGIVTDAEAAALTAEIIGKLEALTDPKTGQHAVLNAESSIDIYSGARVAEAPDIVVGYNAGYGCSEESTLGEITEAVFADNDSRWSGNHLMAPEVVPGVLLSNQPLAHDGNKLTDVTATLLDYYDLPIPTDMVGESFLP
ncbi:MAG: alkaline phosphatase family protein [Planctomycetota bacterium]|nr:alkaline phosphatase family protein [Planctomycetota bacterium]